MSENAAVYDLVLAGLADLGLPADLLPQVECSILLRHGYCAGRGYRCGDYRAYWLVEENVLEFYTPAGELACRLDLAPTENPARRAA